MSIWRNKKLVDIAKHIQSGGTPKSDNLDYYGGDIPFVSIEDMTASGKYLTKTIKSITDEGLKNSAAWLVPENAIMYSIYATLGLPVISKICAATNQAILNIVVDDETTDVEFLYYYLLSLRGQIHKFSSQTTQSNLNARIVKNFDINIPAFKPEQTRIAQILSTADKAITQTEALIAKYQRIKTGLMQDLLTRGIDQHGNIRSEQTHRFKTEKGLRVPEEWEVKTFNELLQENIIADIQDGNHGEKHPKGSDFVKEGVPFIMASDISKNEIDFSGCKKITEEQYHSLRIGFAKPEDVLLSHKASIGFVAVVPEVVDKIMLTPQVTYYRIKNKEKLYFRYLSWFMRGEIFQNELSNLAKQSTRDYIGILMQRNLTLAYPNSKTEQILISEKIEAIDNHIKIENKKLSKAQSLKTGLMQDLLSGKVRVNIKAETLVNS